MATDADEDDGDDSSLLAGALDALAALRHPLTSLAVLQLSCPLPLPSATTLGYLSSCGLSELELRDVSIQRSASDGASNLLRCHAPSSSHPSDRLSLTDSIRARGAAMVRFACCLPSLRRLSLCNAAFSIPDVASLAALTQLEELSLDGAMECGAAGLGCGAAPEAAASPAYRPLLASLPKLRRLRLPMAVSSCPRREWLDTDDEDENLDRLEETSVVSGRTGSVPTSSTACIWSFPPGLEALTIPLCSLNGPVFRAACEAYDTDARRPTGNGGFWGGVGSESTHIPEGGVAGGGGLRSLQVTCAPGYTVWEGSFLNAERDFAALSRLGPSLESLHLSLELGGSGRGALRRDRLRGCLRHLRQLAGLRALQITETWQPVCFAIHKKAVYPVDVMSCLIDDAREPPRRCARLRLPVVPHFPAPPHSGRPWTAGTGPAWSTSTVAFSSFASPPFPSSPCLDSLLSYWPELHSLVAGSQRAVRSSRGGRTRLVVPGSLDEVMVAMVEQGAGAQEAGEPQTPPPQQQAGAGRRRQLFM